EIPAGLPGGRNLSERITFDGYFLRLLAYDAADVPRYAPWLVGRLYLRPEPQEKRTLGWYALQYATVPAILLLVWLGRPFGSGFRRRAPASRRENNTATDEFESGGLDRWLAQGSPPDKSDPEQSGPAEVT